MKWCSILMGGGMLLLTLVTFMVKLGNEIGFGRAVAKTCMALFMVAWIITGVILLLKGLKCL